MSIKITIPNTSSDTLTFGSANTPTAAQIAGIDSGSSNGQLAIYTTASGTSTERVRVDSSGNVGIGTATPVSTSGTYTVLHINGTSAGGQLHLTGGGSGAASTDGAAITQVGSDLFINNQEAGNTYFYDNSNLAMTINSSGIVGIGTSSPSTYAGRLSIVGSATSYGVTCALSNAASDLSNPAVLFQKYDNNTTTSQVLIRFLVNQGATPQGQINANGASAAAFGSYSDRRLKENITDLPSQLANIMALRTVEFDYIESEGGGHQIGFIAQEVQEIYPDLVGEREDGMLTLTDLNKNDARLIKAIQEMKTIIDTQASTITSLTTRIAALEGAK